jgi:hypothetical protein
VQDHPAIALGTEQPNPASYLIWDDQRDGATNSNIYFARRDPLSGTWSADVKVNSDTGTRNQSSPAIALDAANNAYAVWDDLRDGTNNKPDQNIYSSVRSAATGSWSTPNLRVNDDTAQNPVQRSPRLAGTAAGIETAVWVDLRASQNNIYASQLNLAGCTNWCPNKRVTDNTSALKDFPDVAVDAANTAYAVWQDSRSGNVDVFFSSLASGAASWAANVKISDDPGTAAQTKPRIGVDAGNNLVAAWIDARTSPAHVRVARRPSGGSWSASIDISPSPANVQSLALSVRPDGFAWAVWGDTRAGATNQDIWGSRYDPALNIWSAPVRLDDDPGASANQLSPAVAFGPAEVMLSWRDNRLDASGDTQARRVQVLAGMTDHFALADDGLNRLKSIGGPVSETFALDGTLQCHQPQRHHRDLRQGQPAHRRRRDAQRVVRRRPSHQPRHRHLWIRRTGSHDLFQRRRHRAHLHLQRRWPLADPQRWSRCDLPLGCFVIAIARAEAEQRQHHLWPRALVCREGGRYHRLVRARRKQERACGGLERSCRHGGLPLPSLRSTCASLNSRPRVPWSCEPTLRSFGPLLHASPLVRPGLG